MEEQPSIEGENIPVKRGSRRSTRDVVSYQEQPESEEELTTKRQEKKGATHGDDNKASEPSSMIPQELTKPKAKKVNILSPRKAAIPRAKGVRIRTEYTSDPSAVFIQPLVVEPAEATNDSVDGFTCNGLGQSTYRGEPNETGGKIKWWLGPRANSYTGKLLIEPPKLTQKNGVHIVPSEIWILPTKESENVRSSDSSAGYTPHLVIPTRVRASQREWKQRNETERTRLWEMLSTEQKFEKDLLRVLEETALAKSSGQDVWSFRLCPQLPDKKWLELAKALKHSDIGFIFTTFPQLPGGAPADTRYQRGSIDGASWLTIDDTSWPLTDNDFLLSIDDDRRGEALDCSYYKFLGGTWVGSGFDKGIIFGKTGALVKQKVEEMCKQIEDDIISEYVQRIRNSDTGKNNEPTQQSFSSLSDDTVAQSYSPENWTEDEERSARAAWDLDEAKKRPLELSGYTYRLGKLCSMMEALPKRKGQMYRSNLAQDPFIDDGRYTYTEDDGWEDHAPWD